MRLCSERGEPPRVLGLRVRLCTARCNRGLFKGPSDVALLSSPRRGKGGPARTDRVAPMIGREHAGERAKPTRETANVEDLTALLEKCVTVSFNAEAIEK